MSSEPEDKGQRGAPEDGAAKVDRMRLLSKLMAKEGLDVEKYGIIPLGSYMAGLPMGMMVRNCIAAINRFILLLQGCRQPSI